MNQWEQSPGDPRSAEGTWEKLSHVTVKGAEYDSPERQPHPKCLEETREYLLDHISELLNNQDKSQLIWLSGMAGVGKSAVAFTIAWRMRRMDVTEQRPGEKRLAGTFFFSRKYTKRCTTGYLFATLAYQLGSNFPSIRDDINRAIQEDPAILDPDKSLHIQMEALFLQPLKRLRLRLKNHQPIVFVVDALDECTSKAEITDFISFLGQALRDPGLPVIHILLTSRSDVHIHEAIYGDEMRSLVHEIPMKTSGEGVTPVISLGGVEVDSDIYIFLKEEFARLRRSYSTFPQPTMNELARLARRAGRRFIEAVTMMKFISDGHDDPRNRLQFMLEPTSELLPVMEVYELYDHILATCANPMQAYLHLSVVAALVNPLPISEISELLGPGEGRDVETSLKQLQSILDIPTDSSLPISIYHSSVRDYALNPSNCRLFGGQSITSPHSLLARSSLYLMIHGIQKSTGLLDTFLELNRIFAMEFQRMVANPGRLQELLQTPSGRVWLQTQCGREWLHSHGGRKWLQTPHGQTWQSIPAAHSWVHMEEFLDTSAAISEFTVVPELSLPPAFRAVHQFKNLPNFLMFSVSLTPTSKSPISTFAQGPDMGIIQAIKVSETFANEARERSRLASDALTYACQNWAVHLSRSPNPWDNKLNHTFKVFWYDHLLSWLERQWCLRGLRSCIVVLFDGQKLAQEHLLQTPELPQSLMVVRDVTPPCHYTDGQCLTSARGTVFINYPVTP